MGCTTRLEQMELFTGKKNGRLEIVACLGDGPPPRAGFKKPQSDGSETQEKPAVVPTMEGTAAGVSAASQPAAVLESVGVVSPTAAPVEAPPLVPLVAETPASSFTRRRG